MVKVCRRNDGTGKHVEPDTLYRLPTGWSDIAWCKAMSACNQSNINFKPVKLNTAIDMKALERKFKSRYTKPTKHELDTYPPVEDA